MATTAHRRTNRFSLLMAGGLLATGLLSYTAAAQDDRPRPQAPTPQAGPGNQDRVLPIRPQTREELLNIGDEAEMNPATSRRDVSNELIEFTMKDAEVDQVLKWIKNVTGKVVIPLNPTSYANRKITVMNDEPLPKREALDMAVEALRLNGIGFVEDEDIIIIDLVEQISRIARTPMLGPDDQVMNLTDTGNMVFKVFQIEEVPAEELGETLQDHIPDNAILTIDPNSNKLIVHGDVGLTQQLARMIDELDKNFVQVERRTFRLHYADAQEIADNITELFETDGSSGTGARTPNRRTNPRNRNQQAGQPGEIGPQVELKLTVNIPTNSVTVSGDPKTIRDIDQLINQDWDVPRPVTSTKMYILQHTDPLRMRDILQDLLGAGGGSGSTGRGPRGQGGQGGAGGSSVSQIVSGIYSVDAIEDKNALVVISKTEQSLDFLDDLIAKIDQPSDVSLPMKYALKHANAFQLAEELNALLAEAGANPTLPRPGEGLQGAGIESDNNPGGGAQPAANTGTITLPWGRQRADGDVSYPTSLIGKVRLVPIVRENALAILAPPAERYAIVNVIKQFDRPGRQVMIEAVIAEVELTDDLAYGLRVSRDGIPLTNIDNSIGASVAGSGTENDIFDDIFDVSTLDVQFDANAVIQALSQVSNVRVLQRPKVYTADNQEARFFEGQQVPFNTGTTATTGGNTVTQNDFRDVGVVLNVRPRITVEGDLDLDVNIELSSIVPGVIISGAPVLDKAETTTQIIVQNNQTVVIGGIMRDRESRITRKVPLLGDIPVVGEVFTSRESNLTSSELLVFITPRVVDTPDEADMLNAPDIEALERMMNTPLNTMDGDSWRENMRRNIIPPLHQRPIDGEPISDARGYGTTPIRAEEDVIEPDPVTRPAVELVDIDDLNR